jgi:hypothetical protein
MISELQLKSNDGELFTVNPEIGNMCLVLEEIFKGK